jgi:hypothetical protein
MKQHTAFLVPLHDLIVRDPITKETLAKQGEVKPLVGPEGRYWKRRLKDGSVKIKNIPKQSIRQKSFEKSKEGRGGD